MRWTASDRQGPDQLRHGLTDCTEKESAATERRKICSPWREPWEPKANPNRALEGRNIPRDVGLVSPLRGYAIRSDRYPRLTPWATNMSPLCSCRNLNFR